MLVCVLHHDVVAIADAADSAHKLIDDVGIDPAVGACGPVCVSTRLAVRKGTIPKTDWVAGSVQTQAVACSDPPAEKGRAPE